MPSILSLNGDALPPESFICDRFNFCLLLLYILNDCVTDPIDVKTVSKKSVSLLVEMLASGLVIKLSFLQLARATTNNKMIRQYFNGLYFPGDEVN